MYGEGAAKCQYQFVSGMKEKESRDWKWDCVWVSWIQSVGLFGAILSNIRPFCLGEFSHVGD